MNGAKVLRVPLPMKEVVEEEMPNIEEMETQEEPGILERLGKATDNLLFGSKPFNPGEKSFNCPSFTKLFARPSELQRHLRRETLQLPPVVLSHLLLLVTGINI
jgi:hypothetical protein